MERDVNIDTNSDPSPRVTDATYNVCIHADAETQHCVSLCTPAYLRNYTVRQKKGTVILF